ncbi:MAG: hypothetical protein WBD74_11485 [Candidatus Aquilonibacter sp.]
MLGATLFALAACGGGGKGAAPVLPAAPSPAASASSPAGPAAKSHVSFVISVPKATPKPLSARRPAYVSPATQSMTISVLQGSTSVLSQTVGLTASSSGCTSSLANVTCTLTLNLNAGSYTASITTYDGTNGTGNKLSIAQNVAFTVVSNQNNIVPLGLSGIPMNIIAMAANAANSVYVVAEDADGNFIVGSGAPTFSATKASGPSVATITQPSSTAPNTVSFAIPSTPVAGTESIAVTASYPSGQTNACASAGAVCTLATPISVNYGQTLFTDNYEDNNLLGYSVPFTSSTQTNSLNFAGVNYYPYWGIAMNAGGTVFSWGYETPVTLVVSSPPYTSSTTVNTGLTEAYYFGAADPSGDVFIPNYPTSPTTGAIAVIKPPYTGTPTQLTAGVDDPYGAAIDSNNKLYVANDGSSTITVYASPYTSVSATVSSLTSAPYGLYISGSKLYVTEDGYVDVFNLPVTSSSSPAATLSMPGSYSYGAAAVDSAGNLWVGCYEECNTTVSSVPGYGGAVYKFAAPFSNGETASVTLTMPASGFTSYEVVGLAFDGTGNLYVDNGYGGSEEGGLLEYSGTITSSSMPTYGIETSTLYYPWGIVMSPAAFTVTP